MSSSPTDNTKVESSRQLKIGRSMFLRLAPVMLWILAICLPMLIGSRVYFISLRQRRIDIADQARQQLMAKAQQLSFRLQPKTIARNFFEIENYDWHFANYRYNSVKNVFENLPVVKSLPDFDKSIDSELVRFSRYIEANFKFAPEFLFALDENVEDCGILVSKRLDLLDDERLALREELSEICKRLNYTAIFADQTPRELRHYKDFPVFNKLLGIAHPFNTRAWRIDGRFSAKLNQNIYLVTMCCPLLNNRQNHVLMGFTIDNIRQDIILDRLCDSLSDEFISLKSGLSAEHNFPLFIGQGDKVEMLTRLPVAFEQLFSAKMNKKTDKKTVIKLTANTKASDRQFELAIDKVKIVLFILAGISLLIAVSLSMRRIEVKAGLTGIIATSFVACMAFPLSAIFWQGLLQYHSNRESDTQQVMHKISRNIRELDQSFLLQSYRRMLLLKFIAAGFERLPMPAWGRMARLMFSDQAEDRFSNHFRTYYLYDALDREFYRGQVKTENQVISEMSRLFVGVSRKLMMQIGAMSGLSENDRNRIGQIADFASGLMEQLMRPKLLNQIYKTQGELFMSDFMARRSLLCSHFLKAAGKIVGFMIFVTENYQLMELIGEMQQEGLFPSRLAVDDYDVELVFYPIDDYAERGLKSRIAYSDKNSVSQNDGFKEIANSLYAGADFNQINNLHLKDPHLIVTDKIFENNVFVFALARPVKSRHQVPWPLIALTLVAVTSCLTLAAGVARMLLMQIPPFLFAMRQIENDRYDWQLALPGSDEFAELAVSINSMRVSLLERKKMMQLVSANAIEAAQSDLKQQSRAKRREAAILFCDIRSFTTISESRSAEEVVEMLNHYFSRMCPIIEAQGGFVDKLIGDAIQAVFYGDAATAVLTAAKCAVQMRVSLGDFNQQRVNQGLFTIDNGIGIAAGTVITGLVGSQTGKLDAALLGNVLQKAQKLEAQSKHAVDSKILLDHESWQKVRDKIIVRTFSDPSSTESPGKCLYELVKIKETT
ncbi:MAG: adenylate/guanylate cyclase domain-containing protein [Candidatus Riflebacteria bacterium]|nr:adenylate/guanylate cyclase domain-containing protein [Candidatus Riflebacteria bacterium]